MTEEETSLKQRYHSILSGAEKYRQRAAQMPASDSRSLIIDYPDIRASDPEAAIALIGRPDEALAALKRSAYDLLYTENPSYANLVKSDLSVRVRAVDDNPVPLRKVGTVWLNKLVSLTGMVVRSANLKPLAVSAAFTCDNGHVVYGDIEWDELRIERPVQCDTCDNKRFTRRPRLGKYQDHQVLRIQELPEELPPGQIPSAQDIALLGDLVDTVRPGDKVVVTGIPRALSNPYSKDSAVGDFRVECVHIEAVGKEPELTLTKEEEAEIKAIATRTGAYESLIGSIAPSILGHRREKEAILLLLAGSPAVKLADGTTLRGDINILLVGDPAISKSELLKFAARAAPRGLYASGKGSSAAGLSAAVVKEKDAGFVLEIGVTVLADQGVSAVDEFDKMRPEDRSALHEVMEQQTCTISKAGIQATLNARTAILAAMNPVFGNYNPYQSLIDNLGDIPVPLLSVGPDEQILVRVSGQIRSLPIGRFVDQFYEGGSQGQPVPMEDKEIEVASMDEYQRIRWQRLKYVFRHRPRGRMYKVRFKGRDLVLSGGHSVYTLENLDVVAKPTSELQKGDILVIAKRLPSEGVCATEVNILGSISRVGVTLHNVPDAVYQRLSGIPAYMKRRKILPAVKADSLLPSESAAVTLSKRGSGFYVPAVIPIQADLMRLLGYFVAEGALIFLEDAGVYAVDFTFNRAEEKLVDDLCGISERLFHVRPTVTIQKHAYAVKVDIRSRIVAEFLAKYFGLKSGARAKRIPDIVFNAPLRLKLEFIKGYYNRGDKGVTASKELASQLIQLFAQFGQVASRFWNEPSESSAIRGRKIRGSGSFSIPIPRTGISSNESLASPPFTQLLPFVKPLLGRRVRSRHLSRFRWNRVARYPEFETRLKKLGEALKGPITTIAGLVNKTGLDYTTILEFISNMREAGILVKRKTGGSHFRKTRYYYRLTERGAEMLGKISFFDWLSGSDLAFVPIDAIEELQPNERPDYVYDLSIPFAENFVADSAVCHNSRFDLILVMRDDPTEEKDSELAEHILTMRQKGDYASAPPIEPSLLRKYIVYSKRTNPRLSDIAKGRIKGYWLDLRRGVKEGMIGATPRTLESLYRLATARARILLREEVTEEDALAAIDLMKRMTEEILTEKGGKVDFGPTTVGKTFAERSELEVVQTVQKKLEGEDRKPVEGKLLKEELLKTGKFPTQEDVDKAVRKMFREGVLYETKPGYYKLVSG